MPMRRLNVYTAVVHTPAADAPKVLASLAASQGDLSTERKAAKA